MPSELPDHIFTLLATAHNALTDAIWEALELRMMTLVTDLKAAQRQLTAIMHQNER